MATRRVALLLAVLALIAGACGDSGEADAAAGDEPATTAAETTTTVADTTAATETTTTAAATTTTAQETTTTAGETVGLGALQTALAQTAEVSSARMEGSIAIAGIEGLPAGTEFTMPFSGAFDNEAGVFAFTMDLSGIAAAAGEDIPPGFEDLFSEMEIRSFGDVAYMRFPFFGAFLGVETEWISMPADEAGSAAGGFSGGVSPANPTGALDTFANADAEITDLGREDVRGVETTRYLVLIDMQKLLETATPEERAEIEAQGPLPFDELPLQVWIGDDNLVYRYVMEFSGADVDAAPGEGFDTMSMTFEIYDYGASIDIAEPDPSDVTDAEELGGLFDF